MIYDLPCREKYVDETVGVWFVFGEHSNGTVDISDGKEDVACNLPRELAEKLIELQRKFREDIYALVCYPSKLKAFHVSESEIWAARHSNECFILYAKETGRNVDLDYFAELTDKELDKEIPEYDEDGRATGNKTTLRRYLLEMTGPGLLATDGSY